MGLCKCPKRKVTNLFCFEHRVNVCEHCLIDNHPKCVVKSYLNWLQDSDYDPNCALCNIPLTDGECVVKSYLNWLKDSDYDPNCALCNIPLTDGEVVRLLCYDVFHVRCLEKHYRSLPSNTAPAGYRCNSCDSPVFPTQNQAGYVTERLRQVLSKYNWARVGLCLPLIDEPEITVIEDETSDFITDRNDDSLHGSTVPVQSYASTLQVVDSNFSHSQTSLPVTTSTPSENLWQSSTKTVRNNDRVPPSTVRSISSMPNTENEDTRAVSRKYVPDPLTQTSLSMNFASVQDPDGADKYKRRSAWSWLKRWLKSRMLRGRSHRDSRAFPRRIVIILLIGLIALLTFIAFATRVGRRSSSNDPNFDPMLNPNIHVGVGHPKVVPANFDQNDFDLRDNPDRIVDPLENLRPIEKR